MGRAKGCGLAAGKPRLDLFNGVGAAIADNHRIAAIFQMPDHVTLR